MAEFEAALGPRTAMIYVLAGPARRREPDQREGHGGAGAGEEASRSSSTPPPRSSPFPTCTCRTARRSSAYSGGKCLRGPQTAGLLLGRKDLVKAAWVHSAPHHGFARGFKVGKEEAIGMLMAVEMWVKRDHDAEWKRWTSWLDHIATRVSTIPGVTTEIVQPEGLSNKTPSLRIRWDRERAQDRPATSCSARCSTASRASRSCPAEAAAGAATPRRA